MLDIQRPVISTREPFGKWLLQQTDRPGLIGQLARCAVADPAFPKAGDPDAIRKRLSDRQAEGDLFEAVEDAELDWLAL